jgi:hypothetical protein
VPEINKTATTVEDDIWKLYNSRYSKIVSGPERATFDFWDEDSKGGPRPERKEFELKTDTSQLKGAMDVFKNAAIRNLMNFLGNLKTDLANCSLNVTTINYARNSKKFQSLLKPKIVLEI